MLSFNEKNNPPFGSAFALILFNLAFSQTQGPPNGAAKSYAKKPAIGHLYGKVLDAGSQKPAGFSTVVLLKINKDRTITGCLVKDNSDFLLDNIPFGQYRLQVGFIGYKKFEKKIMVTVQNVEEDLGAVSIALIIGSNFTCLI